MQDQLFFTMIAKILTRSLANFHRQYAGHTHEFTIYAVRQRARADNLLS